MQDDELARLPIILKLPSTFGRGEPAPARMTGATIIAVGTIDGGGLVIDYRPRKSKQTMRVVLGMGEGGMTIRYHGARRETSNAPKGRITAHAGN